MRMSHISFLMSGLLFVSACSSEPVIPSVTPGYELTWTSSQGEKDTEFVVHAADDFVVYYAPDPDNRDKEWFEEKDEYTVVYSRFFMTECGFPFSQKDRRQFAAFLAGDRKQVSKTGSKIVYRDRGLKKITLANKTRELRVIEDKFDFNYLDPQTNALVSWRPVDEEEDYEEWVVTETKKSKPLDPEIITFAKENCVPEPLAAQ